MNSSATSFFSDRSVELDGEQREKIKKATRKPFEIGRRSTQNLQKSSGAGAPTQAPPDDLLSEISTPDINYNERSKIMEALNKREKDR